MNCPSQKEIEAQVRMKIRQNEESLRKLNVDKKACLSSIMILRASKKRKESELICEQSELRRVLHSAWIAELEAKIDLEYLKLQAIKLNKARILQELENLGYWEPEMVLPYKAMHRGISSFAPPQYLPPPFSR